MIELSDWKIRQEMYHRMNSDYGDDLTKVDIIYRDSDIISDVIDYIELPPEEVGWVYPAKSYIVGICYAHWISQDFNEDFYELLNDEMLLYNNDPYFVTYSSGREIYDKILEKYTQSLPETGVIGHIRGYYEKELMID